MQVLKIKLPDFDEQRRDEKLSIEEMRSKMKEKGIVPHRQWNEKPMYMGCTGDIFDPYVPPEGDGKISPVSSSGVKQLYEGVGKKGKSYLALRKIRNIDYEFDVPTVAVKAQEIYVDAHTALAEKNEEKLHDLATEKGFPEMMENVKNKTVVWKFLQSLEPSRVVHIRCNEIMDKSNLFAQVTVRFHTQQILAVYDRFGRLMLGSEETPKDVLEYVVFEKHLTNPYGTWKIHAKLIPDWMPPKEPIARTYSRPDIDEEFPEPPPSPPEEVKEESQSKQIESGVATA
ncbi:probable 39S ribosomal protein L45, mitochondrial [Uloborus diversus]|uniref:probable 39S ribosomal protein L45, mitochondrial n=1 Tax=Uloborus diversus TaxID=327109 RepID=UPI0024098D92|nr:probable 39S ribosomal protein L45, mitochondrial [Uloborus diversus]